MNDETAKAYRLGERKLRADAAGLDWSNFRQREWPVRWTAEAWQERAERAEAENERLHARLTEAEVLLNRVVDGWDMAPEAREWLAALDSPETP